VHRAARGAGGLARATATSCALCLANFYSNASGAAACTACPANASGPAGSSSRLRCSCDDASEGEDGGECAPCLADFYCKNGLTIPCKTHISAPAGSAESSSCTCLPGFFEVTPNRTLPGAREPCSRCAAGRYCPGGKEVRACAANSSSPPQSGEIEQCWCDPGHWRGCIDGRNSTGTCTTDYRCACVPCGPGDVCFDNRLFHCPAHSSSPRGTDDGADCTCNSGYFNVDLVEAGAADANATRAGT